MKKAIVCGYPKSGNVFLWRILMEVQKEAGYYLSFKQRCGLSEVIAFSVDNVALSEFGFSVDLFSYRDDSLHLKFPSDRMPFFKVDEDLFFKEVTLARTHDCPKSFVNRDAIQKEIDVSLYIVRDPRAVYVSKCHHLVRPDYLAVFPDSRMRTLEEVQSSKRVLVNVTEGWRENIESYLECTEHFELVVYEELLAQKEKVLKRLTGLLCDGKVDYLAEKALEQTAPEQMKKRSKYHVRDARADSWKDEIDPKSCRYIEQKLGPLLEQMGYERFCS